MRETILLAPGANESEVRRAMARFGIASIGLRIMNGPQLARYALMKAGQAIQGTIISREEELALTAQSMQGINYFTQTGLSDIRGVAAALREIRLIAVDGDKTEADIVSESLRKGPFSEKNKALYDVYERLVAKIRDRKLTDGIALMRAAEKEGSVPDAELWTLEEFPLSPLEERLAQKLSGGAVRRMTLPKLYGKEEKPLQLAAIRSCYGIRAEAETALGEIRDGKAALDTGLIAVSDARSYSQLFFDLYLEYGIPISFGCGIPIGNSYPAELLQRYTEWSTKGFFGGKSLNSLLFSDTFDRSRMPDSFRESMEKKPASKDERSFMDILSGLRLTNDAAVNAARLSAFEEALTADDPDAAYLPALKEMAAELALPKAIFFRKYARLRPVKDDFPDSLLHRLDAAALSEICNTLDLAQAAGQDEDLVGLQSQILAKNVCRESSRSGALHVCTVREAMNSPRENLYILGLSAALYPGSPRENHLLLDDDIKAFPSDPEDRTSYGKVRRKQDDLSALLRIASALGSRITLSYAGYDTAELKRANASSMLYKIFAEAGGSAADFESFNNAVQKVEYFDHGLSRDREIGKAVIGGAQVLSKLQDNKTAAASPSNPAGDAEGNVLLGLQKVYSPSALSVFYACPRRFYLKTLLGIPEPEDEKPFEIIPASDAGTLAHSLMEFLGEGGTDKQTFLNQAGDAFDRYIAKHPPLTAHGLAREKEDFLAMMDLAYDQDAGSPRDGILLKEEDIRAEHSETGIRLHGFPDRVEITDGAAARIIDFKTARRNSFVENDIDTCLQSVIYAYLLETKLCDEEQTMSVTGGEFRMLRLKDKTGFVYDDAMKAALTEKLKTLKAALDTGQFDLPALSGDKEKEICAYCRFAAICGKKSLTQEDEP